MKKMMLALGMLICLSVPSHATNCDSLQVSGVPDSVLIDLKKKCVDATNQASPAVTASQVSEYAELGKNYGIALSEVAKSVGSTVNDLAQTPVGKFMLVMVAYKVMGQDLIGVVGGFVWFCVMLPLWTYMFHRLVLKNRTYRDYIESYAKDDKPKVVRREYDALKYDSDIGVMAFFMGVILIMICGAGFLMVF